MGDEETARQPAAITTATSDFAPPGEIGDAERERLEREIAELRGQVARLGLALQVERERNDARERRLGAPLQPEAEALEREPRSRDERVSVSIADTIRTSGREAFHLAWRRVRAARPAPERAPAVPWTRVMPWEVVAFSVVLLVAVIARFWDVRILPEGFQGDEAAGGIVARQIRDEGWIGPYSGIAAGTPTGFYYAVALSMTLFDDEVLAIRIVPAFFGVLTVVALYLFVRRNFGGPAGLASGLALATLGWHVHYSRIAFPNIAWPLFVLLGLLALAEAWRGSNWRWWAASGALFGLGIYTYNSHVLLMAVVALAVVVRLFGWPAMAVLAAFGLYSQRPGFLTLCLLAASLIALLASKHVQDGRRIAQALAFAGAFLLVSFPMVRHIADDANDYFGYGQRLSVFNSENVDRSEAAQEWAAAADPGDRLAFLSRRYLEYWDHVCCNPEPDFVDATGVTAVIPLATLVLAAIGLGFALWRGRPAASVGATLLLAMPLASALSVDFALRRSLVVTAFVALFAGVGVAEAIRWALAHRPATRLPVIGLVVFVATLSVYRNFDDYFGTTARSEPMRWTLAGEMVDASRYLATLPAGSYVYFYSERWPWTHEIRRFFAPDARGEDRSRQFGDYGFAVDPSAGRPVFLFLDNYRGDLASARARFPGGETIVAGNPNDPDYIVYLPPEAAAPAPVAPGGSPDPMPTEVPRARRHEPSA